MENNTGFSTSDAVLTAAMSGGGFGGRGYGGGGAWGGGGGDHMYPGNSVLAAETHANGTAVKESIDCGREALLQVFGAQERGLESVIRGQQFTALKDGQTDLERRLGDRSRDTDREIAAVARDAAACCCETQKSIAQAAKEAAECCCEAKLQACKDTASLTALIIKENSETRAMINSNALDSANAKITQLETINALDHRHRRS